jgi:large subunit ribosomal protein L9
VQTDGDDMTHKGTQALLLQDVEKLGRKGDVVNVAPGYLRNYLAPRRLAMQANDGLVAQVQRQEDMRRRHEAQSDEQAREVAHTLNRTVLTVKARAGTEDRLYGSVTSTDIADAIWKARRLRVDRRKVELDEPIKALGSYKVAITVFNDVRATVKVMVVPAAEGEEGAVEAFEAEPVDDDLV